MRPIAGSGAASGSCIGCSDTVNVPVACFIVGISLAAAPAAVVMASTPAGNTLVSRRHAAENPFDFGKRGIGHPADEDSVFRSWHGAGAPAALS